MLGIEGLLRQLPAARAVAMAANEDEARLYRQRWPDEASPLLMIHSASDSAHNRAVEAILEISSLASASGTAVLVLDGPDVPGYREQNRRAWNRTLANLLSRQMLDVQVLEYSSTWSTSPPRPR